MGTGFFFAAGTRKAENVAALFRGWGATVDRIRDESMKKQKERLGADQPIFWNEVMNRLKAGTAPSDWGFKCLRMCGKQPTCNAGPEQTLDYCNMDPYTHPTGWEDARFDEVATYHANYAANNEKIAKLEKMKAWGPWDSK